MLKLKLLLPLSFMVMTSFADQPHRLVTLPNPGAQLLNRAQFIKPAAAETKLLFTVWLKFRNPKLLEQLVHEVYDPNNPRYQHFLTRSEYEEQFAPSEEAAMRVQQFFLQQGMQAQIVNHRIQVIGSVAQIKKALHITINDYSYEKEQGYANTSAPKILPEIAPFVAEITGLNTLSAFHTDLSEDNTQSTLPDSNFLWSSSSQAQYLLIFLYKVSLVLIYRKRIT